MDLRIVDVLGRGVGVIEAFYFPRRVSF